VHHELALVDQSQLGQRQCELDTSHERSVVPLPLELLNGLTPIPAHEFGVPIDVIQDARHDVLLAASIVCAKGSIQSGLVPVPGDRHADSINSYHPTKDKGVGLAEDLGRVTTQAFVGRDCTRIAAPVQRDVDRVPKISHYARAPRPGGEQLALAEPYPACAHTTQSSSTQWLRHAPQ
jgi:hypothetical protein